MRGQIKFWVPEDGETEDDAVELHSLYADDLGWAAEEAAEWYHDNCDGWEASWPKTFRLSNGKECAEFVVDREYTPTFVASLPGARSG